MANIAAQRIKREFKEVIKSEEVSLPSVGHCFSQINWQEFRNRSLTVFVSHRYFRLTVACLLSFFCTFL